MASLHWSAQNKAGQHGQSAHVILSCVGVYGSNLSSPDGAAMTILTTTFLLFFSSEMWTNRVQFELVNNGAAAQAENPRQITLNSF